MCIVGFVILIIVMDFIGMELIDNGRFGWELSSSCRGGGEVELY